MNTKREAQYCGPVCLFFVFCLLTYVWESTKWEITSKVWEGTSLLVQWVRLCVPNAGGPGSIPGQRTKAHMPQLRLGTALKKKKKRRRSLGKEELRMEHRLISTWILGFVLCCKTVRILQGPLIGAARKEYNVREII